MLNHAEARVRSAMNKLLRRHKDGVVALVVPEPLASVVRRCIKHAEFGDLWKATAETGQWEVIEASPQTITQGG